MTTSFSQPLLFSGTPDLWIPIPNTLHRLPLTWKHMKAIQRLSRFFAHLYTRAGMIPENNGLEKYKSWMITLFQVNATIYDGTFILLRLWIEA